MLITRKFLHFKIFSSFQAVKSFSSNPSHYETLGISTSADKELITQKYEQLLRQMDEGTSEKDNKEKSFHLNEAYQTLVNDEKRIIYDQEISNNNSEVKKKNNRSDIIWGTVGIFILYQSYRFYERNYVEKCPFLDQQNKGQQEGGEENFQQKCETITLEEFFKGNKRKLKSCDQN